MIEINMRAKEKSPYVVVCLQECERMNTLLSTIRFSLFELDAGLKGQLNITDSMEVLSTSLALNRVPAEWEKYAYFSKKTLLDWFIDLLLRILQLTNWSTDLITPKSLWIPGLFNPMSFLTAIMQVTARATGLPLDKMAVDTHVTTMLAAEEAKDFPEHGLYVHGLFMEGARWAVGEEAGEATVVGKTPTAGFITESRLKQLLPPMPLLYLRAVPVQPKWIATGVGYLRQDPATYECPVYVTTFRGHTYVFLATLRTFKPSETWILAGCALVLQEDA
jgi:dynein heavy chain